MLHILRQWKREVGALRAEWEPMLQPRVRGSLQSEGEDLLIFPMGRHQFR
jgi:hypothetical protein